MRDNLFKFLITLSFTGFIILSSDNFASPTSNWTKITFKVLDESISYSYENIYFTAQLLNPEYYSGRIKIKVECRDNNNSVLGYTTDSREIMGSKHEIQFHIYSPKIERNSCKNFSFYTSNTNFLRE